VKLQSDIRDNLTENVINELKCQFINYNNKGFSFIVAKRRHYIFISQHILF